MPESSVSPAPRCVCSSTGASPRRQRRPPVGGWIWRGTAVWDKGNSRPQKGRFRQQAEYIVWGSNGDMPISRPVPCLPGVFKYGNPQNRIHLTEKPLQLMRDIVEDHRAGRPYSGPLRRQWHHCAGRRAGGLYRHRHRGHGRVRKAGQGSGSRGSWSRVRELRGLSGKRSG